MRDISARKDLNCKYFAAEKSRNVLAGRYLAWKCNADREKQEYGLDDINIMQEFFNIKYPDKYGIVVYRNLENGDYSIVFPCNAEGTEDAKHIIQIIQWYDYENKTTDYFGLLGRVEEFLEANSSKLSIEKPSET